MKKITVAFALLLVFALSFAGIQDRSSWVQLVPHPGDYIKMPELSSAPSTPDSGWGAVYATGNNIYFKSDAGVVTSMINVADVAGAVTFDNGLTMDNTTNNALTWTENSETLIWTFGSNTAALSSSTGINSMSVFDNVAGTITHAANGAADDFTLSVTGAQDSSLILSSAGTAADALQITASAGGIDITSAATFDIDLTATGGTIKAIATEAAADQFKVDAQGAVAGVAINLETTDGGILLNADGATGGDIELNAADDLTLTAAGAVAVTGVPTITLAGAVVLNTVATFTDSDATPDVTGNTYFNTNTTGVTITDFDGAGIAAGQLLVVTSKGAITYDVTSSGIKGGTTDIITAAGDVTTFLYDGTDWLVVARMDMSDDLN